MRAAFRTMLTIWFCYYKTGNMRILLMSLIYKVNNTIA